MKKILGIMVLYLLFSGNAYAGVNKPGTSRLSEACKIEFNDAIKLLIWDKVGKNDNRSYGEIYPDQSLSLEELKKKIVW